MKPQDHRAILAAEAQIKMISWINAHPDDAVPAQIVRDSMAAMSDFMIDRFIFRLDCALSSEQHATEESIAEPDERDPSSHTDA